MEQLSEQYKDLREEQSRLENQRLNILFSSSAITAIAAVISQITEDKILLSILQILLLITLIWGLSMYKSLSFQIFKTIAYNVKYIEKDMKNQWLKDSMKFADNYPTMQKCLKQWTHLFTLLTILSVILSVSIICNISEIKNVTKVPTSVYLSFIGILQCVEIYMCIIGVFHYDNYDKYLENWENIK